MLRAGRADVGQLEESEMKKLVLMLALAVAAVAGADIRAVTPVPQNADTNSWWMKRHAQKLE